MRIGQFLKKIDAFPKIVDIEVNKTFSGALLTITSSILMTFLVVTELKDYLTPQITEELFVDTTRGHKLKINLDITIPTISCDYLSLDAMDSTGEQHLHIEHDIFKRRLNLAGFPIEEPKKENIQSSTSAKLNETKDQKSKEDEKPVCGSCYGANHNETHCCNTCQDVIDAYRERKWNPNTDNFEQCKNERKLEGEFAKKAFDEGCHIFGTLEVNRMGGSFHIAPGRSFSLNHIHVHDVQPFSSSKFNTSHRINKLTFGEEFGFGLTNPLNNLEVTSKETAIMYQYFLKIVPTMFVPKEGSPILRTNQFSVTTHQKSAVAISGESAMPGVFFSYELSPLMVKYTEKYNSLSHFLVTICGIIGGIFTVASLIDSVLHKVERQIRKKIELGKFT
ncbi:CLUMA_CG006165, isoform A [Clunio marinus]|uniref:Endoplasmic reticulum-Golgi intermediate compartment protein 3 n=1 Tax=Clunio marinus TaxID=568069 RepID=A0A1J1HZ61_9DIPT|nr:CLUMA_CG006165, isoform A [Clunio marinus]